MKNIRTRQELKTYFERGDRPTEQEFSELIDGYVHLNELNFGFSVRPTSETYNEYYDFYISEKLPNVGMGHIINKGFEGKDPEYFDGYKHVLGRPVAFKKLKITLDEDFDMKEYQPTIIIERYKQKKKRRNRKFKPLGYYQEKKEDAVIWKRQSEYVLKDREMVLDLEPIHYFRPSREGYKEFSPSGSIFKPGSFKYSKHGKPFAKIRIRMQILINGIPYRSNPLGLKIVLGSSGITDAINFLYD